MAAPARMTATQKRALAVRRSVQGQDAPDSSSSPRGRQLTPSTPAKTTSPLKQTNTQVLVVAGGVQGARQLRRWVHAAQAQQRALTLDLQRAAAKKAAALSSSGGGAGSGGGAASARRGGAGASAVAVDARFFRRLMVILRM